jgi:hypothetical protein
MIFEISVKFIKNVFKLTDSASEIRIKLLKLDQVSVLGLKNGENLAIYDNSYYYHITSSSLGQYLSFQNFKGDFAPWLFEKMFNQIFLNNVLKITFG